MKTTVLNIFKYAGQNYKRGLVLVMLLFLLTILLFLPDVVYLFRNKVYNYLAIGFLLVPLLFFIPTVIFFWNLRIYYYILGVIAALSPIALIPVLLINSQPNTEMLGLVMDTNYHEVSELMGWKLYLVIALTFITFFLFIKISRGLPNKISFKKGAVISLLALGLFLLTPFSRTTKVSYYSQILKNSFKTYYPFRLGDALSYLSREMKNVENYKNAVADFSFGAFRKDNDSTRKIHVLLIGETARYDHWSVNGYPRETSPLLAKQPNLISFNNVATSGTMTAISVPLIISRADATNFDYHKKEKSILAAFKEVNYRSYWVSNQSKYGLTGNIGMHYNDGDTAIFNGWGANENNFYGNTDSALLPMIKQIINTESRNDLFMVVHMIGSHWRYVLRYPEAYTRFKPVSEKNRMMMGYPPREIMINEYDNSILFTDYIINSIIEIIKATGSKATLTYVSDHGENLGDNQNNPLYFHGYDPQYYTAKVPLFFWASDQFISKYPQKFEALKSNRSRAVSSGTNLFFTLLDLANIGYKNEDSHKSAASLQFTDSEQIIMGSNGKQIKFSSLGK